ncbi:hypothetical protein GCM10022247_35410 [Allokutzneria multivorans]|uniref:Helix-turn-helix protein n=1 Tax=Allokutzneria multivorans TaxID=1142134 RepID=A0ABP7SDP6_9PSEU
MTGGGHPSRPVRAIGLAAELGPRLRVLREDFGIDAAAIAFQAEVELATVHGVEAGDISPDRHTVETYLRMVPGQSVVHDDVVARYLETFWANGKPRSQLLIGSSRHALEERARTQRLLTGASDNDSIEIALLDPGREAVGRPEPTTPEQWWPDPDQVHTRADFAAALLRMKISTGLSFDALARQAEVTRSALHSWCSGERLPAEEGKVVSVIQACGGSDTACADWVQAWRRVSTAATSTEAVSNEDGLLPESTPSPPQTTNARPTTAWWTAMNTFAAGFLAAVLIVLATVLVVLTTA